MTKADIKKVLKQYGYNVYETFDLDNSMFLLAGDGDCSGYEIWISFESKVARKTMLSTVMVHDSVSITDWFWDNDGNEYAY